MTLPMTTIIVPTDVTYEFIGFVATFLTVATVWVLWYAAEKSLPNEAGQLQLFLIFIVVIIPFVMLIYFGFDAVIDDAVAAHAGLPTKLPNLGAPEEIPLLAVVYIGLTGWLGLRWRRLSKREAEVDRG